MHIGVGAGGVCGGSQKHWMGIGEGGRGGWGSSYRDGLVSFQATGHPVMQVKNTPKETHGQALDRITRKINSEENPETEHNN